MGSSVTPQPAPAPIERTKRLLIVSSVRLLRDGLVAIFEQRLGVQAVHAVAGVDEARAALASFRPTMILLDVSTEVGLGAAPLLAESAEGTPLLGFAARAEDHDVLAYARTGITGFVAQEASIEDLFNAVEHVVDGELVCTPRVAATLFRQLAALASHSPMHEGAPAFTGRERQIVRFLAEGLSNKEIARRLSIEVSTVKNHVHHILDKLNVASRGEAAARLRAMRGSS